MSEAKHTVIIDVDDFTVGDLIDFEDVAGLPLADAMKQAQPVKNEETGEEEPGSMPMKVMLALLWVSNRKNGTTLDDVRNWKISELDIKFAGGEAEGADPQGAASD